MTLAARVLCGDQRAIARAITLVERGDPAMRPLLKELCAARAGRAHVCGITGAPGSGKSTLVAQLAMQLHRASKRVAVVAVDPSSPFTGGALLGDRIRMGRALESPGLFVRSLASRGQLGGLSLAATNVVAVLDSAGYDIVLVETVGTGQSEIEIMRMAHTTVLVTVPGLGDRIQADKAGILEIADILVVNKSDRDGADETVATLNAMLDAGHPGTPGVNTWCDSEERNRSHAPHRVHLATKYGSPCSGMSWRPPLLKTTATDNTGVAQVACAIDQHRAFLVESGRSVARSGRVAEHQVRAQVAALAAEVLFDQPYAAGHLSELLSAVTEQELDPHNAAAMILNKGLACLKFEA